MKHTIPLIFNSAEYELFDGNHYVIWSGGADSTTILVELCKRMKGQDKTLHVISLVSNSFLHPRKVECERNARKNILQKLRDQYEHNIIETELTFEYSGGFNGPTEVSGIIQPLLWITNILPLIKNNSKVYFGYISGDHFWLHIDEFNRIFKASCDMLGKKNIRIEYPLSFIDKTQVLSFLKENNFIDDIWTCEMPSPDNKPCGNCVPCKHYASALVNSELELWPYEKMIRFHSVLKEHNLEEIEGCVDGKMEN